MHLLKTTAILLFISVCCLPAIAQTNKKLAAKLAAIYRADQQYRVAAIVAAKKYGSGSVQDKELMQKQDAADLVNLTKIEKIIATYGYPGRSLVGAAQSKVAFMVVQHNDQEAQEKYLPLFIKAADNNQLDASLLPLMIDRVRTAKGQPQLYGTQLHEITGGGTQIFPIEDEVNVNLRRKKAGLPPLDVYLKSWGINYTQPTDSANPNPATLYYHPETREPSPVEAVGGDDAIFAKLVYPEAAKAANITGAVTVEYTVDTNGNTKNVSVVKGLGYGCDEEAIRVIKETKYTNKTGEETDRRMKLWFPYKKK
jgi:TonB family protein